LFESLKGRGGGEEFWGGKYIEKWRSLSHIF